MLIEIEKIKVADRIRKDFGDISELANDIKENGLINPPVVTPEYQLIASERRLRAMQELGYQQIEVRMMNVKDALHQLKLEISENENRKDFSFNEKMQWAKLLENKYSKIAKGNSINNLPSGSNEPVNIIGRVNQKVAEETGFGSRATYERAKYIFDNADEEIIKALDENKLSINKAYTTLKEYNQQLQKRLSEIQNQPPSLRLI